MGNKKNRNKERREPDVTEYLVGFRPKRSCQLAQMIVNPETGQVRMLDTEGAEIQAEQRHVETIAETKTGKTRVLSRLASRLPFSSSLSIKPDIATYDWIAAVDATPSLVKDRWIIPVLTNLVPPVGDVCRLQCRVIDVMGVQCDAEKLGWVFACYEILFRREHYRSGQRIALISDAHLGIHKQLNDRAMEILPGMKLPDGFDLGYGKEDRSPDTLLQSLVRLADRIGRQFLAEHPDSSPEQVFEKAVPEHAALYDQAACFLPPEGWFKRATAMSYRAR